MVQNLPTAEIYQKEADYMPWGILISEIIEHVIQNVPKNGTVLDLMCGTGYLLGKLQEKRPDVQFTGVDLEDEYIQYAKKQYPSIEFITVDVLDWDSGDQYDAVLCTGGLHHIEYHKQESLVKRVAELVKPSGFAIIADPYIDDYSNEEERKLAAAKLGYEYLIATIKNGAPDDVAEATASLIPNDVALVEFKSSIQKMRPYFDSHFGRVDQYKTWPEEDTEYGDYYFVVKP